MFTCVYVCIDIQKLVCVRALHVSSAVGVTDHVVPAPVLDTSCMRERERERERESKKNRSRKKKNANRSAAILATNCRRRSVTLVLALRGTVADA